MQNKKENQNHLFDKLIKKNYKNELEKILEHKFFGENAKSLLLEILYKIEIGYKDYAIAKVDIKSKDEYIEDFIKIIDKDCKNIKIVQPNSENSKILDGKPFKINEENNEIICLPIARKLLYAISMINKKEKIVQHKYHLLSTTLSDLINIGDNMNAVEPLRDFDGWSWTTVPEEYESIECNLIYQMLLILVGKDFIADWIKGDTILDYIEKLEDNLSAIYGEELSSEIIDEIERLSILIKINLDNSTKETIEQLKNDVEENLKKFEDKQEYIKELTAEKNRLNRQIKKIDKIISDKELLQKEYVKRNSELSLEDKIFSIRILAKMMTDERLVLFKKMKDYNSLLMPQNFLARKTELEEEERILNLVDIGNYEKELKEKIKDIQKLFLECFKIKVKNAENRHEIIKLINQYRYYCLLPFNTKENIFELKSIKGKIDTVAKNIIRKAIENKVIIEFSQDEKLNYEIIKNLFCLRITNLEEVSIKITKEKVGYCVQFFDEKVADKIFVLDTEELNKKQLKIKINKKVRVFEKM